MRLKKNPIFILLIIVCIINIVGYITGRISIYLMYRREIKGIVYEIGRGRGGDKFHYDKEYKSKYFTDEYFFEERFSSGIEKGDSVYKSSNNDTLYIYKKINSSYKVYKIKTLR